VTEVRLSPTTRVEAFSDGVMAIAMTLLVLEIHVPQRGQGSLLHGLAHQWVSYVAYLDSFLTIGVIWLCHHSFFGRIRQTDTLLQWGNLLLMLVVAFLPFPTAILSDRLPHGGWDAKVATAFYGIIAMLQALAWMLMWLPLRRRPELFEPGFDAAFAQVESRLAWIGVLLFAACTAVAFAAPWVSLVLIVLFTASYGIASNGWYSFRRGAGFGSRGRS
jgi:uncharacterized membrane protein